MTQFATFVQPQNVDIAQMGELRSDHLGAFKALNETTNVRPKQGDSTSIVHLEDDAVASDHLGALKPSHIVGITVDPKKGDILGPITDQIIDPNETYDVAVQSLIDDMMTGVQNAEGYTEVEWTYFAENVGAPQDDITGTQKADIAKESLLPGTANRISGGTAGPGGNSFNADDILLGHGFSTENLDSRLINHDDFLTSYTNGTQEGEELASNDWSPAPTCSIGDTCTPICALGFADKVLVHQFKGAIGNEMESGTGLRSDNRFVFEPMDVMSSLGGSIDSGLDADGGFQPREVSAVQIGEPPEPKLWLQILG